MSRWLARHQKRAAAIDLAFDCATKPRRRPCAGYETDYRAWFNEPNNSAWAAGNHLIS